MSIENVAEILRTHAAAKPDEVSLVLGEVELTCSQLYERARRVASGLVAAGVGSQDRVAFSWTRTDSSTSR